MSNDWKNSIKSKSNAYDTLNFYMNQLQKAMKLPKYYHFIGKNFYLDQDLAMWDYRVRRPKTVEEILEEHEKARVEQEKQDAELKKQTRNKLQLSDAIYQRMDPFSRSGKPYTPASKSTSGSTMRRSESFRSSMFSAKSCREKLRFDVAEINKSIERSQDRTFSWKPSTKIGESMLTLDEIIISEYGLGKCLETCHGDQGDAELANPATNIEPQTKENYDLNEQITERLEKNREKRLRNLLPRCPYLGIKVPSDLDTLHLFRDGDIPSYKNS